MSRPDISGTNNWSAKLDEDKVREIRRLLALGLPSSKIAERFGVSAWAVNRIKRGEGWVCVR